MLTEFGGGSRRVGAGFLVLDEPSLQPTEAENGDDIRLKFNYQLDFGSVSSRTRRGGYKKRHRRVNCDETGASEVHWMWMKWLFVVRQVSESPPPVSWWSVESLSAGLKAAVCSLTTPSSTGPSTRVWTSLFVPSGGVDVKIVSWNAAEEL